MLEQDTITVLTTEQVAAMEPDALVAYAEQLAAAAKITAARVAEIRKEQAAAIAAAKEQQSQASREALQAELRASLKFPILSAETLARVNGVGAAGFNVAYSLTGEDAGHGIPDLTFGKTKGKTGVKAGVKISKITGGNQVIIQMPVSADWLANASPAQQAEDEAEWTRKAADGVAKGFYNGDMAKALGAHKVFCQKRRLHKLGVAGY